MQWLAGHSKLPCVDSYLDTIKAIKPKKVSQDSAFKATSECVCDDPFVSTHFMQQLFCIEKLCLLLSLCRCQ